MQIKEHIINNRQIGEVLADDIIINKIEDGTDLLGNVYYQGFDAAIIYAKNITPDFFDLKTRIAGEILQKFSTYRMPLAIVGDYSVYTSKSLADFIYESNKGKHVNFVASVDEALGRLTALK
ncbi:MAG: DUF4180 domain-containing protein [Sphingobacteriaceae bacterium]|nr:MAG: DUF4180 domain-containing protein [Sphingobacteriaceae bacterium]